MILGIGMLNPEVFHHWTPYLNALDLGKILLVGQVLPVFLEEFGPNEKVQVRDLLVLSD